MGGHFGVKLLKISGHPPKETQDNPLGHKRMRDCPVHVPSNPKPPLHAATEPLAGRPRRTCLGPRRSPHIHWLVSVAAKACGVHVNPPISASLGPTQDLNGRCPRTIRRAFRGPIQTPSLATPEPPLERLKGKNLNSKNVYPMITTAWKFVAPA